MHAVLFYAATIGFAVGIFLRSLVSLELPVICMLVVVSGALACLWRYRSDTPSPMVLLMSVALLFLSFGMLRMETATWSETHPYFETKLETEIEHSGIIVREPDVRESTTHYYVEVNGEVLLLITDRYSAYHYGDTISFRGMVTRPEPFETDLGRTFNYTGYLHARQVSYMLIYPETELVESGGGNYVRSTLFAFKHAFMDTLEGIIPEPQAGLGEGLLLGVKRALGEDLETTFRKTGIIHIVVLSGYNIMLVVAFVLYIFAYFFSLRVRAVFGVLAITAFALVVGLSATVVRASIMAGILLFAQATGHTPAIMRTLLFAGCVMLLFNPYLLVFDTGFQLSFLATMGLILIAPHIEARLTYVPTLGHAREFLTATIATQIFVLPLLLYQIGEFSVVSVVVNVLVLPMVPIAMFMVFLTGLFGMWSATVATPFAFFAYLALSYILVVAEWFAALPFASFIVPAFPFWLVPVSYVVLGYLVWRFWGRIEKTADAELRQQSFKT